MENRKPINGKKGHLVQVSDFSPPNLYYVMTTLPKSICSEMEKICKIFVQGDTESRRKVHLINWQQVCQPLINRGLRIKHMKTMNDALIMKLA